MFSKIAGRDHIELENSGSQNHLPEYDAKVFTESKTSLGCFPLQRIELAFEKFAGRYYCSTTP